LADADSVHVLPQVPGTWELKRTIGPILRALGEAVTPGQGCAPCAGYRERLGIGRGPVDASAGNAGEGAGEGALERLFGVHAAFYIAWESFGCPDLEMYDFDPGAGGMASFALDDAISRLGDLDGVGGMDWDVGSRFAVFLAGHGGDARWMAAAGAILRVNRHMRRDVGEFGLDDLIDNVHVRFGAFPRSRLYSVHGDMASLIRDSEAIHGRLALVPDPDDPEGPGGGLGPCGMR